VGDTILLHPHEQGTLPELSEVFELVDALGAMAGRKRASSGDDSKSLSERRLFLCRARAYMQSSTDLLVLHMLFTNEIQLDIYTSCSSVYGTSAR
jgi:hypothetical protein